MIWLNLLGIIAIGCGIYFKYTGLAVAGCTITLVLSTPTIYRGIRNKLPRSISAVQQLWFVTLISIVIATIVLLKIGGFFNYISYLLPRTDWDIVGIFGQWSGAIGQIAIATLAAYVSWRQYIVSRDLTIEQNRLNRLQNTLTQQQTIDNYFQGISDLVLDDKGFLEDWPQERSFAIGRTAALLGSVNAAGKARVLRFLSRSKLLTPLQRDLRLGRVVLNGNGGYDEDRIHGVRVINLGVILAGTDIAQTDLRWTDLSDANLIRSDLSGCNLAKANLARTILYQAKLNGVDIRDTRFFYGSLKTASPRAPERSPDYITGEFSGAIVEDVDFTDIQHMSQEQREYFCTWCGEKSRQTIPGGCTGIQNQLGSIGQSPHFVNEHIYSARSFDDD
jgi:uncharacterized protein YjbI with pentapeptide repeats